MHKYAKVSFLGAFITLVICFVLRFLFDMWVPLNTILLAVAAILVAFAILVDWKLYWDFLTMRTTKHGMNMGLMILLVVTLLVCVNYIADRHNKTWDVTKEKLNSVSEQTTKILTGLKDDLVIKVFYRGPAATEERLRVKQNLALLQAATPKLKVLYINSYVDTAEAIKYLQNEPDRDAANVIAFAEYKDKKIRIDSPYGESEVTSAMIKATREGQSKVYFITGHGERDPGLDDEQGMKQLTNALEAASFHVETLNLIDKKAIPKDAAVIAIVGPQVAYLDAELKWLREYIHGGGKIFIAIDPGQRHNLANLTKTLGVQFANNYVFTNVTIEGGGPAVVLGRFFDPGSEVTRSFPSGRSMAIFPLVSEVTPAPDRDKGIEAHELVKSDAASFTVVDPTQKITQMPKTSAITIGVQVKGPPPAADSKVKAFEAIVFGDSDFLANRGLGFGVNRDLAVNAIAMLADQKDLISIKPKAPAGTSLILTEYQKYGVVIALISLPLTLLIFSGILWFRRRGA